MINERIITMGNKQYPRMGGGTSTQNKITE